MSSFDQAFVLLYKEFSVYTNVHTSILSMAIKTLFNKNQSMIQDKNESVINNSNHSAT